jgi:hypothetical protein
MQSQVCVSFLKDKLMEAKYSAIMCVLSFIYYRK